MTEHTAPSTDTSDPLEQVFGLDTDPFLDHPSDQWFYADPVVMQRLDLLLHLLQFGDTLILVHGPEGSGKSTLLRQLRRRFPEHWEISVLHGNQIHSDAELVAALGHDFKDVRQETGESFGQALMRHARALQQQGRLAVVLVDDADRLDDRSLATLLTLGGDSRETCRHLRLLLFGAPGLERRLIQLGLHVPQAGSLQSLEMPRFDEQQAAAYLMYRLAVAGYSGESPFTALEIQAFHKRSEGWPGPLNALASEALRTHATMRRGARTPPTPEARRLLRRHRWPAAAWIAAALTLVATGSLLWLWTRGTDWTGDADDTERPLPLPPPTTSSLSEESPVPSAPTPAPTPAPPAPDSPTEATVTAEAPVTEEAPAGPAEPPEAAALRQALPEDAPVESPAAPNAVPTDTVASTAPRPGQESPSPTPAPATPADSTSSAASGEPGGTTPSEAAAMGEPPAPAPAGAAEKPDGRSIPEATGTSFDQWFASQPPGHYTLQLLGVRERKAAERFLKSSGLDPAVTGVVETRYRGGPWHVVIHGSYPDRAAARDAIAELPPRVRRNHPWPRTFGSLKAR